MNKYDEIINMEHPEPKCHERMSIEARAAQFAPFAALTGYEDEVKETARLTDKKIILDDEAKLILDDKLNIIENNIINEPEISFTYFIEDTRKDGGSYNNILGIVKKIDKIKRLVIFKDNTKILVDNIIDIESEIFKFYEQP